MKFRDGSGFTLVELIITMVVMTILLVLGTVMFTSLQAQARDSERKSDVEAIARGLEARYTNGNSKVEDLPAGYSNKGTYPGINEVLHAMGCERTDFTPQDTSGYLTDLLPGTTQSSLTTPGRETDQTYATINTTCDASEYNSIDFVCIFSCPTDYNFKNPNADSRIGDRVNINRYIYAPIEPNTGQVCCCGNCRSFYLYYRSEVDGQIYYVKSKYQ